MNTKNKLMVGDEGGDIIISRTTGGRRRRDDRCNQETELKL
jgi:hypothetical protein